MAADLADMARSKKSSPASTASCISAASRSKARGTPSTRPISSAATICSRRPTAPASSAWYSPPPIMRSVSIRATRRIGVDVTTHPDSRYGVSKAFGEALGALYADKHGLRVTCLRIGNFGDAPLDKRRLAIWLKPDDLVQLIRIGLEHRDIHFEIFYGVSDNADSLVGQQQCAAFWLQTVRQGRGIPRPGDGGAGEIAARSRRRPLSGRDLLQRRIRRRQTRLMAVRGHSKTNRGRYGPGPLRPYPKSAISRSYAPRRGGRAASRA